MFESCVISDSGYRTESEILELIREVREKWQKQKEEPPKAEKEAEEAERLAATGYCFNCESWCHGDCGNYSNDPKIRAVRQFKLSMREEQYGRTD